MQVKNIKISGFRNLSAAALTLPEPENGSQIVALIGENGAGKTSVLEALSLLSPGRGLHKANPKEQAQNGSNTFGIFIELADERTVGIGLKSGKKQLQLDGSDVARQTELATLGNVLWLTPRQDRLFLDGPAPRRDMLDRLTFGLIPSHAEDVARYKHHAKNRLKLLAQHNTPDDWLTLEESQAAAAGVKILQNRHTYLTALAPHLRDITLAQQGATLEVLEAEDAVDALAGKFLRSRERDTITGSTGTGPMKVDVGGVLRLDERDIVLGQTSSGQHKRALIDLTLAHAKLIKTETGAPPLILLDEFTAHLDPVRQQALLGQLTAELLELEAQIWLTDVDLAPYADLPHLRVVEVLEGGLTKK